jgi:endonuclease III
MPEFKKLIAKLKKHYGAPTMPPAKGPFELVMWENACYLLPDERRAAVFEGLRKQVGLNAKAILKADPEVLLALATMGGMRPKVRVFRWQEIARITISQFDGDLDQILKLPYAQAKKALKQFPNIGDPGAEKILMFCGASPGLSPHQTKTRLDGGPRLPLEWNGLRVLTRVGYGRWQKNYGAAYRSVQEALKPELPRKPEAVAQAHLLLRQHGKEICRDKSPQCYECPVKELCAYPAKQVKMFSRGGCELKAFLHSGP